MEPGKSAERPLAGPLPEAPTSFLGHLRSFGPGFVIMLTWLGAGDVVAAAVAGGNYGYALMWAMVAAIALRFFFVSAIARYQLCNPRGEGVVDALVRLNRAYAPFLLIASWIFGAAYGISLTAGLGEVSAQLAGGGPPLAWAAVWVVTALAIGLRPVYARVEVVFKFFLAMLALSLLTTAAWVGPDPAAIARGTLALELPEAMGRFDALGVVLAMIGAVGGSLMNLVYPYFLEQKGWRTPAHRRVQTCDLALALAVMALLNLSVWTLGAELIHAGRGRVDGLDDLTRLLSGVLGPAGRLLFELGIFAAIYTSFLGSALGLATLASHAWRAWRREAPRLPRSADPVYRATVIFCLLVPLPALAVGRRDFVSLTLAAHTLSVLGMPALAGGLWWITASTRFAGERHRNRVWENALMALLFGLAAWASLEAVRSLGRSFTGS